MKEEDLRRLERAGVDAMNLMDEASGAGKLLLPRSLKVHVRPNEDGQTFILSYEEGIDASRFPAEEAEIAMKQSAKFVREGFPGVRKVRVRKDPGWPEVRHATLSYEIEGPASMLSSVVMGELYLLAANVDGEGQIATAFLRAVGAMALTALKDRVETRQGELRACPVPGCLSPCAVGDDVCVHHRQEASEEKAAQREEERYGG